MQDSKEVVCLCAVGTRSLYQLSARQCVAAARGACSSYSNHCCSRTGGEAAVSELGRCGGDSERLRRVGRSAASRAGLVLGLGLEPLELSRRCDSGDAIRLA